MELFSSTADKSVLLSQPDITGRLTLSNEAFSESNHLRDDSLIIGSTIAVAAAAGATASSLGIRSPLLLVAIGAAAAIVGQEGSKETLFQLGREKDRSLVGSYLDGQKIADPTTGLARRMTLVGDVVLPYGKQFTIDASLMLLTMGVGALAARGINTALSRAGSSRLGSFLGANMPESLSAGTSGIERATAQKSWSKSFVHGCVDEVKDEIKEDGLERFVRKVSGNNTTAGFIGGAVLSTLKQVEFGRLRGSRHISATHSPNTDTINNTNTTERAYRAGEIRDLTKFKVYELQMEARTPLAALHIVDDFHSQMQKVFKEHLPPTSHEFTPAVQQIKTAKSSILGLVTALGPRLENQLDVDRNMRHNSQYVWSKFDEKLGVKPAEWDDPTLIDKKMAEHPGLKELGELYQDYLDEREFLSKMLRSDWRDPIEITRRRQLEKQINSFCRVYGLPSIKLRTVETMKSTADYSSGLATITIPRDRLLAPDTELAPLLFHELTHLEQETLVIRKLADELMIDDKPTNADLQALRNAFQWNFGVPLCDRFAQTVLQLRDGVWLSADETKRAAELTTSLSRDKGFAHIDSARTRTAGWLTDLETNVMTAWQLADKMAHNEIWEKNVLPAPKLVPGDLWNDFFDLKELHADIASSRRPDTDWNEMHAVSVYERSLKTTMQVLNDEYDRIYKHYRWFRHEREAWAIAELLKRRDPTYKSLRLLDNLRSTPTRLLEELEL